MENNPRFPTSYAALVARMNAVDPHKYSKTRNYLDGAVTELSPYISRGVLSMKQLMDTVLAKGFKHYEIEKFLQELAWREYFQRVWQRLENDVWKDVKQPQPNVQHHQMVAAIDEARTGIDVIDAQIKELYEVGYLHNHLRMYVASLTCCVGGAYWKQPAKWLYYHLLDGDIASNTLNWQWVAGAFSLKQYYFNGENLNKYTGRKQGGTFIDTSYEALREMDAPPAELAETKDLVLTTKLPATNLPALDTTKHTLLYNAYNLDPLWRKDEEVNRVLLLEPSHFAKNPVSEKVMAFILDLSKNITGIQVYAGEVEDLVGIYEKASVLPADAFISKEHPAFGHYPGIKDSRDWMFPQVTDASGSFFSFWKKCSRTLK